MPIYEYECGKCRERFEALRALWDDDSEVECPKCGVKHPQRVFSAFATGSQDSCCVPSGPT